jgi:hypothetical protein
MVSPGWFFGVGTALLFIAAVAYQLWAADLSADPDRASADFETDAHVLLRRGTTSRYTPAKTPSGSLRVLIYGRRIAIRCLGVPRWLSAITGFDLTLDASECEVEVAKISQRFNIPGRGNDYLVLATNDRRRGQIEIALRPQGSDLEQLRRELISAGANPRIVA